MKKLEAPGQEMVQAIDIRMTCEVCGNTGHSRSDSPETREDAHFFFQAEDGRRGDLVTEFRRVLFRSGLTGDNRFASHRLKYGLLMKMEKVDETMREWEMRDSAAYSLPHTSDRLDLIYNMVSTNNEGSNHYEFFIQDTYRKDFDDGSLVLNYGMRLTYWDWNKETLFSPRATIAYTPARHANIVYRFSTGVRSEERRVGK